MEEYDFEDIAADFGKLLFLEKIYRWLARVLLLLSLLERLLLRCPTRNMLAKVLMSVLLLERLLLVCPAKDTPFLQLCMMYTKAKNPRV